MMIMCIFIIVNFDSMAYIFINLSHNYEIDPEKNNIIAKSPPSMCFS